MRKLYAILLFLSLIFVYNCGPKTYYFGDTDNIRSDYRYLSYYESSRIFENEILKTNYEDFSLERVTFDKKTEFWVSKTKIISFENKNPKTSIDKGVCHHIEVFKNNFLFVFKDDCWAASPGTVKRDNVLVLDLNTKKVYKTGFGNSQLSMSKSHNDYCCENSKNSFAVLYVDLEAEEIIIHNNFGSKSFKMTPYYKSVF